MTAGFLLGIVVLGNSVGPHVGGMGAGMPGFLRLLCAPIALAMGAGFVASGRLLLRPPLMFAATEKGIVSYFAGGRYGGTGTLVPWERIVELAYVERVIQENQRLAKEVSQLRARVAAFESSRWWRLHPRFALQRIRSRPADDAQSEEAAANGDAEHALPLDFDEAGFVGDDGVQFANGCERCRLHTG